MITKDDPDSEEAKELARIRQMTETVENLEAEAERIKSALAEAKQKVAENSRKRREREVEQGVITVRTKLADMESALEENIRYHKASLDKSKALATAVRGVKKNLGAAKSEATEGNFERLELIMAAVGELWDEVESSNKTRPSPEAVSQEADAVALQAEAKEVETKEGSRVREGLRDSSRRQAGVAGSGDDTAGNHASTETPGGATGAQAGNARGPPTRRSRRREERSPDIAAGGRSPKTSRVVAMAKEGRDHTTRCRARSSIGN